MLQQSEHLGSSGNMTLAYKFQLTLTQTSYKL